jgi:predicted NUDIX family NTP pyrophosphohydrolase
VLLAHPGGPYFANRDEGAWTVPKGLVDPGEALLDAARREFAEEIGFRPEAPLFHPLGSIRQKNGKTVHAWAFAGDFDPTRLQSNDFETEWPPRSGQIGTFPEIDRAAFFGREEALRKVIAAQAPLVTRALSPETRAILFGP